MLKFIKGDIWDNYIMKGDKFNDVVVTTNIGWDPDMHNANNMGAGTALNAAMLYPFLPSWYGHECIKMWNGGNIRVIYNDDLHLFFFPVKPMLDIRHPERSWCQKASYVLIESGLKQLKAYDRKNVTYMTLPGAGNGGLDKTKVRDLIVRELSDAPGPDIIVCDHNIVKDWTT